MPDSTTASAPSVSDDETDGDETTTPPHEGSADANREADDTSAFLAALRAPIREEAPAGDSVLYESDFRELKTQINNIGSVSATVDYDHIVELARRVLTEQSKDLRAAGYLVIGEARTRGAAGVSEALRGLWILIDEYWEDVYPEPSRMKSRGAALQFVSDRLPAWFETATFEQEDRAALVEAYEALDAIQSFGLDEMGEHAPSFSSLLKKLEGVIGELPEPEPDPALEADAEASGASDSASDDTDDEANASQSLVASGGAPSRIETDADADDAVRGAASYYREADLTHVAPYRLVRAIRWGEIQGEPPNEDGTTQFEAPREQRREYLEGLLQDDEYETLVREAEASFQGRTFHVWLDLQRLVVSALEALGAPYRAAAMAVRADLALFVQRLPSLPSLTFRDGTPFASPLTVERIQEEITGPEDTIEPRLPKR
jgi:type VI secretion system protein VasJ